MSKRRRPRLQEVRSCRRRARTPWQVANCFGLGLELHASRPQATTLAPALSLVDEYALLEFRSVIARVRSLIAGSE